MHIGNYAFDQEIAMALLEKVGLAVLILVITWVLAKAAKWAFAKLVNKIPIFQRGTGTGASLGESLGKIVSLLIWLFGLLAVLNVLGLGAVASPIDTLLETVVEFIPRIVGAGIIFFVGVAVARIARDLLSTALATIDFDKWANRGGVDSVTGNSTISQTIGTIVYVVIVLFFSIAALETLAIKSISEPASAMLRMIFAAIPNILGAAILLGLGFLISKFAAQTLREILPGLGVDRALNESGLISEATNASTILARVTQVAILLFFAIAATRMLGFPELTAILNEILDLGGRVIFGAVVIGFGFLIANLLARVIAGEGKETGAATIVKWATILLFTFMGLSYTGVGDIITERAFTAIAAGIAVATALAFGLGGREWAARKLDQLDDSAKPGG